jgi:hypothetical protein
MAENKIIGGKNAEEIFNFFKEMYIDYLKLIDNKCYM